MVIKTIAHLLFLELKPLLNEALRCGQCLGVASAPIVCTAECYSIVGCKRCILQWIRSKEELDGLLACPKCRSAWTRDAVSNEVTGFIELKGFDELIEKLL